MKVRRMKRAKTVRAIWICSSCFEIKELRSRGMCCNCYEIQRKADIQTQKEKAEKNINKTIAPTKMMHMRVEQIVRKWDEILRGSGILR